ncbi:metal ABC transporter substrate-binding protein (plasmid) [Thioclava litoralis]|uniref:Metal ABC transporter substrate-binding protein n=1 Tax=Thioclava litoralis TaxID=3076557 RepID=A0ABZ1E372_9RHOB|nr:metal ABC transporter substrate-binding protein [Thioclava sp. FTW29]
MTTPRFLKPALSALALSMAMMGAAHAETLDVVTSFTVLGDVVKNVGGAHVTVRNLVPVNGDPHDYEPSPEDAKALKAAPVTFLSGEGLENWFDRLAKASGSTVPPVIVSEGIKTHEFEEDGQNVTDPHVWNSIPNVLIWVDNIEAALSKADPADAADFKANAASYKARLTALDAEIRAEIEAVPEAKRKVLTSHDAFGYFGQAYGITFLAPQGVSTETEASAADVAKMIDQIKADGVKTYFVENSNDPRLVKQIAAATGAEPGGELYPEALSDASGPAPSYEALMRYNAAQITKAISQ